MARVGEFPYYLCLAGLLGQPQQRCLATHWRIAAEVGMLLNGLQRRRRRSTLVGTPGGYGVYQRLEGELIGCDFWQKLL